MFEEILSPKQKELLPLIKKKFGKTYFLVGGTAIALQIGHRRSIDFDLFKKGEIDKEKTREILSNQYNDLKIMIEEERELTVQCNAVQMTFYNYRFDISPEIWFKDIIKMPKLLDLAAMKAYALGGRANWKDYVDLYFIMKSFHSLEKIESRCSELFKNEFDKKIFRQRLSYFYDIDDQIQIECIKKSPENDEIKKFFKKIVI